MTSRGQSREHSRLCPLLSSIFKKAKRFEFRRSVPDKAKVERLLPLHRRDGDQDHPPDLTVHLQLHFSDGELPLRVVGNGDRTGKSPPQLQSQQACGDEVKILPANRRAEYASMSTDTPLFRKILPQKIGRGAAPGVAVAVDNGAAVG